MSGPVTSVARVDVQIFLKDPVYMCVCVCMCVCTYVLCMYVCVCMYVCTYVRINVCMYECTYVSMYYACAMYVVTYVPSYVYIMFVQMDTTLCISTPLSPKVLIMATLKSSEALEYFYQTVRLYIP